MRSTMFLAGMAFAGSVALCLTAAPAGAETVHYKAMIMPASEVPPVTDSKAKGQLAATYDTVTKVLSYDVTYADLTGPASAAHFHGPAPVGTNAGVMVPIKGELTLTDAQAKALTDGDMYFNIHTAANKNGEMRGQVLKGM